MWHAFFSSTGSDSIRSSVQCGFGCTLIVLHVMSAEIVFADCLASSQLCIQCLTFQNGIFAVWNFFVWIFSGFFSSLVEFSWIDKNSMKKNSRFAIIIIKSGQFNLDFLWKNMSIFKRSRFYCVALVFLLACCSGIQLCLPNCKLSAKTIVVYIE